MPDPKSSSELIGVSNAHLMGGESIEVCRLSKCFKVKRSEVLTDSLNDIGVLKFEANLSPNAALINQNDEYRILYMLTPKRHLNLFSGEESKLIKLGANELDLISPQWMIKNHENSDYVFSIPQGYGEFYNFESKGGMSGFPLIYRNENQPDRNMLNKMLIGRHRYLPFSKVVDHKKVSRVIDLFVDGQRGDHSEGARFPISWHYFPKSDVLYRKMLNGFITEIPSHSLPSGGASFAEGGGASFAEGGGASFAEGGKDLSSSEQPLYGVTVAGQHVLAIEFDNQFHQADFETMAKMYLENKDRKLYRSKDAIQLDQIKQQIIKRFQYDRNVCFIYGERTEYTRAENELCVSVSLHKETSLMIEVHSIQGSLYKKQLSIHDPNLLQNIMTPFVFKENGHKLTLVLDDLFLRNRVYDSIRLNDEAVIFLNSSQHGLGMASLPL